jgi:hypothetical protein
MSVVEVCRNFSCLIFHLELDIGGLILLLKAYSNYLLLYCVSCASGGIQLIIITMFLVRDSMLEGVLGEVRMGVHN